MSGFSNAQVEQLLRPINPARVLADGKGHAHVSQQDVLAHLIRVFGFGAFDVEVLAADCVFEQPRDPNKPVRFDVCYRALVRLTVRNEAGERVAHYENGSTATAQNQSRGDAHDLAYKSAISLSVKRAAIALGDQFGLSLYNKGQRDALVRGTLVGTEQAPGRDMQEGVPQQVALGHDEIDVPLDSEESPAPAPPPPPRKVAEPKSGQNDAAISKAQLGKIGALMSELGMKERDEALGYVASVIGHQIESRNDLTKSEASKVIEALAADADRASAEAVES